MNHFIAITPVDGWEHFHDGDLDDLRQQLVDAIKWAHGKGAEFLFGYDVEESPYTAFVGPWDPDAAEPAAEGLKELVDVSLVQVTPFELRDKE